MRIVWMIFFLDFQILNLSKLLAVELFKCRQAAGGRSAVRFSRWTDLANSIDHYDQIQMLESDERLSSNLTQYYRLRTTELGVVMMLCKQKFHFDSLVMAHFFKLKCCSAPNVFQCSLPERNSTVRIGYSARISHRTRPYRWPYTVQAPICCAAGSPGTRDGVLSHWKKVSFSLKTSNSVESTLWTVCVVESLGLLNDTLLVLENCWFWSRTSG